MADPNDVADNTDVVITDKELFDHAISDAPAEPAAPAPAPSADPAQQQQPQHPSQSPQEAPPSPQDGEIPRDPQGRFAPKGQPQAAPQQPQRQPDPSSSPQDHRVPLPELMKERDRAQRAESEVMQMRQAWAQFQAQQQAAAQQQQAPQTIFDNPDDYLTQRVIEPLRQEMQMREMQRTDKMSREFANHQYGSQAIDAALADMTRIRYTPHGEVIYRQIMETGHPYGALMQWHQQARAQQAIGPDPQAWLRQKQQEWVKDPAAQKAVLDYVRQQQQAANRPPNVSLPPSLSSMPASSGRQEDQGDLSNESLYRFAIK